MIIMHHWSRIPKDRVHYEQKRSRIGARSLFSLPIVHSLVAGSL